MHLDPAGIQVPRRFVADDMNMLARLSNPPPAIRRRSAAIWLAIGLACLFIDDRLQPYFTELGRAGAARQFAEHWQQLAETLGILCFLAFGAACAFYDRGKTVLAFAVAVSLAGAAVQVVKHLVGRARPNLVHDVTLFYGPLGMWNDGPPVAIDSMPSGHTAAAFAMATALTWRWPMGCYAWYLLAAGVGVARVLVDRHFLSDVVLGALLGTAVSTVVCRRNRRIRPLAQSPQTAIKSV